MSRAPDAKRPVNSRAKGKRYEREIAAILATWLGCDVKPTPMSGGYGSAWSMGGDLMASRPWRLCVECKDHRVFRDRWLWTSTTALTDWWRQCARAATADQVPVLIIKGSGAPRIDYAVLRPRDLRQLVDVPAGLPPTAPFSASMGLLLTTEDEVVVVRLDELVRVASRAAVLRSSE